MYIKNINKVKGTSFNEVPFSQATLWESSSELSIATPSLADMMVFNLLIDDDKLAQLPAYISTTSKKIEANPS